MAKIHYGWGLDPDSVDENSIHVCGSRVSEFDYDESTFKQEITCKKCLKNFDKYKERHEAQEEEICRQMGEMADFLMEQS